MDTRIVPKQSSNLLDARSDLYGDLPTQFIYTNKLDLIIKPSVHTEHFVQFEIPKSTTLFTSPHFFLHCRFKIVNKNGETIPNDTKVALANAFPHSMISDLIVRVGDKVISGYGANQSQLNYFLVTFGSTLDTLENYQREVAFYAKDEGNFDAMDDDNPGFAYRRKCCFNANGSMEIETISRIFYPLAYQRKLLIPGMKVTVEIRWAPWAKVLNTAVADLDPKIEFLDTDLLIERYTLQPELCDKIFRRFSQFIVYGGRDCYQTNVINYSYKGFKIFGPMSVNSGISHIDSQIINGTRPDAIAIFFIEADRDRGSYAKNPHLYSNLGIVSCQASFESVDRFPTNPYITKMLPEGGGKQNIVLKYMYNKFLEFQGANGIPGCQSGIKFQDFAGGYFVVPIIFQQHGLTNSASNVPSDTGITRFRAELASPTTQTYHMFAVAVISGDSPKACKL